jgi:NAD(P)-dependent dehydrogenase (short-subunit alcohol dehydrogenase family)
VRVEGAVALVTGGASGLGRATAERLAGLGARVVVLDLPGSDGKAVAAGLGGEFAPADVTDPESVEAAVRTATGLGPLRILVNCAGISPPARVVGRDGSPMPLDAFVKVVQINLVGTFNVTRVAAAAMTALDPVDGERGVLVSTASAAAYEGQIGQAAYAASKGGIVAMTLPIARELARKQIRVVTIAPGLFETPMMASLPGDAKESLGQQVPHPSRLGRPEEYAALVQHIVENPMLNGETIRLDGAIRMAAR